VEVVEVLLGAQLLLEDQLRGGGRVEGRSVVLVTRGQRLEQHRGELGSQVVLEFPFQLHPPVLEPGPHLRAQHRHTVSIHMSGVISGTRHASHRESPLTCVSVRLSLCAVFTLSPPSRYLCLLKIFSSLLICSGLNFVRTRRCAASFSASLPSSTERHPEEEEEEAASLSYPEE